MQKLSINEPKDNINEEKDKKRENNVDFWMKEKFAPIFYDNWTLEQIRNKQTNLTSRQGNEAKRFVDTFDNISDDNIVFSIGEKDIFFFKQGGVLEERPYKNKKFGVKGFQIKNLKPIPIQKCPLVLTSIKVNRNLSARTFILLDKEKHLGNIKAIEYVLNDRKARVTLENFAGYLNCLSSVEFETLIAKILEENGLFVPAYKGGFIKNFDLLCRNSTENPIKIGENEIEPNKPKLIQIKLMFENDYEINDDYFYFCIESKMKKKNVFDAETIQKLLNSKTLDWLEETLCWADNPVPNT